MPNRQTEKKAPGNKTTTKSRPKYAPGKQGNAIYYKNKVAFMPFRLTKIKKIKVCQYQVLVQMWNNEIHIHLLV